MKNIIIIFCSSVILSFPFTGLSQNAFFSVGGNIALPNASGLNRVAGNGFGGSLRFEASWSSHVSGMATLEFLKFAEKVPYAFNPGTKSKFTAIPIQFGIKYYSKGKEVVKKGLFFSAEAGLLFASTKFSYAANPGSTTKNTDLAIAPGVGYLFGKLEASFRPQFDLSEVGINVYYLNFRVAYTLFRKHT